MGAFRTKATSAVGLAVVLLVTTTSSAGADGPAGLVFPTDTEVLGPAAGDAPDPTVFGPGMTTPTDSRHLAYGWVEWRYTRYGRGAGLRVTLTSRQSALRYRTTTDGSGRWRMTVPDGTYDLLLADPSGAVALQHPKDGLDGRGFEIFGQTMSGGLGSEAVARPAHSCTVSSTLVVEGTEGWAPGADPATTRCAYSTRNDVPDADKEAALLVFQTLSQWAVAGIQPLPPPTPDYSSLYGYAVANPASPLAVPATSSAPAEAMPIVRARVALDGTFRIRIGCPDGTPCAGTVVVRRTAVGRSKSSAGVVLARATVKSAATVTGRPTADGRRMLRRNRGHLIPVVLSWKPEARSTQASWVARVRVPPASH